MRVVAWLLVGLMVACSAPPKPPAVTLVLKPPKPTDPKPPALRLPTDVKPLKAALELTLIPADATTTGSITFTAEIVKPTSVVWLNGTDLKILNASLNGSSARVFTGDADTFALTLDRELAPGPLTIRVAFTSNIDKATSRGLYSAVEAGEGDDNEYAYTYFEPIDARRAFPCFDEPSAKIPWTLTFHIKDNHTALGNAPIASETAEENGMKRVELEESRPLPSYLVAFIVGPFELVDGGTAGKNPTPIRFAIPKGRSGELGYAKRITPKVVAALESYFEMAYPYKKLDVAVVPRDWGTMEHPGLVAMGQNLALIRPEQEVRARTFEYANILAHELGHYWFGDYVTMAWWDDTWLNEGLGTWLDLIITDAVEPAFKAFDARVWQSDSAMRADETIQTRAVRTQVTTRDGIEGSFDNAVTYFKGASVFRMFEASIGREQWRTAMRAYLAKHSWGNATADDLLASLIEDIAEENVAALRTFLEQPGVPRVSGTLRCKRGDVPTLDLAQTRALPQGITDDPPKLWSIPVCVRYGGVKSTTACTLLKEATGSLALGKAGDACPTWVMLNGNANGYYRSVIDPATAKRWFISNTIRTISKPTVAEKLMVVTDLISMKQREEIGIDQLLSFAPIVVGDRDERVAEKALAMTDFGTTLLDPIAQEEAKRFQAATFVPLAKRLGWTRAKGDSQEKHELRIAVLERAAELDPALTKQGIALATKWLATRTGIDDELVPTALRIAAIYGDQAWFDTVVAAAKAARDRVEQERILESIGSFRDPALLAAGLQIMAGGEFDLRESTAIFGAAMAHRETRPQAMQFAVERIADILPRMRDDEAGWILAGMAQRTCDAETLAKVEPVVTPLSKKYDGADLPVARGLDFARTCIARAQREKPLLEKFLSAY